MMKVFLPDGSVKEFKESGVTGYDLALSISEGLARSALAVLVDGVLKDLNDLLVSGSKVQIITFRDEVGKVVFRHSTAHLMAQAIMRLYPSAKLTIGPVVGDLFYYDIAHSPFKEADLLKIEEEMKKIVKEDLPIVREEVSVGDALKLFGDNKYKVEILKNIEEFGEGATGSSDVVSLYRQGEFVDLCRGPHVPRTGVLKSFKLLKMSAAYWRADENNDSLQRIYGTSFPDKKDLKIYLEKLEDAKKRDHRKLGRELDLFTFSDLVGSGLPLFTPKGTALRTALKDALESISARYDYQSVTIPHIAKIDLYKKSGHADKFEAELFKVHGHYNKDLVLKPVNCPHHTQIYASRARSYRDLPLRYMESTMQYRDEKPGELSGLARVRAISVDDGHIFCRVDQIKQEAIVLCNIVKEFYSNLGMYGNHWVSLSVKDPNSPEKYIGDEKDWEMAQSMLREVSDELGLDAKTCEGEAAIYGPKLDFMFKDSLDREWQLATVQIDFAMPKRFDLRYADESGGESHPVMIHRAILGSYERFMALLIEHFAGKFPVWLSPVQVKVLSIADRHLDYAKSLVDKLKQQGVRVEADFRSESVSKKVRDAQLEKVNYALVVGDSEVSSGSVTVRSRDLGVLGVKKFDLFLEELVDEIRLKK